MEIDKSVGAFAWDLSKVICKTKLDANVLISPASIACTVTLLALGAKGNTKSQIKKLLHVSDPGQATSSPEAGSADCGGKPNEPKSGEEPMKPEMLNQIKEMLAKLISDKDTVLTIANGLFAQLNFPISEDYKKSAKDVFNANVKSVDFEDPKTTEEINKWVDTETNSKINNLFSPNSLSKRTSMVIANALYFKGNWKDPFKKENTKDAPFTVKKGVTITVPMMSQTGKFNYADLEDLKAQLIELQYGNGGFCMFIILPKENTNVEEVFERMTFEKLVTCIDPKNLQEKKVELQMPSFKIEDKYELTSHLQSLGMIDAFNQQRADFSGISNIGLFVTSIVHQCFIEVNEEGSEAAGASGAVLEPKSLPIQFRVDHPCMFLIVHKLTNAILFISKLTSPCK